jgi:hypothetical protein
VLLTLAGYIRVVDTGGEFLPLVSMTPAQAINVNRKKRCYHRCTGDTSSIFTKGVVDKGEKVTTGVDDGESTLSCENLHEFSKKIKNPQKKKMVPTGLESEEAES